MNANHHKKLIKTKLKRKNSQNAINEPSPGSTPNVVSATVSSMFNHVNNTTAAVASSCPHHHHHHRQRRSDMNRSSKCLLFIFSLFSFSLFQVIFLVVVLLNSQFIGCGIVLGLDLDNLNETSRRSLSSSASFKSSFLNIRSVYFSNENYVGYISENVSPARANLDTTSSFIPSSHNTFRRYRNTYNHSSSLPMSVPASASSSSVSVSSTSIYIRFVDLIKPSIRLVLVGDSMVSRCDRLSYDDVRVDINSDEDVDASQLFEIDRDTFKCTKQTQIYNPIQDEHNVECDCPIRIRLMDDSARDRLNREAKDVYSFQLKASITTGGAAAASQSAAQTESITTSSIIVRILDDNDLEPMFDPSEYTIVLNECVDGDDDDQYTQCSQYTSAFSRIGRVIAKDPDLSRNALVRYYLNCNTNPASQYDQFSNDNSAMPSLVTYSSMDTDYNNNCNKHFGVNWLTGHIYLKQNLNNLFKTFNESEKEFLFEIKAIDSGVKLNVANNLLNRISLTKANLNEFTSSTNTNTNNNNSKKSRKRVRYNQNESDEDQQYEGSTNRRLDATTDNDEDDDDIQQRSNKIQIEDEDLVNLKLIKSAVADMSSGSNGANRKQTNSQSNSGLYYGTSLEAALVRVKLIRSSNANGGSKSLPNIKFQKITNNKLDLTLKLKEQIKFKMEKYFNVIIPFGLIQSDSFDIRRLVIKPTESNQTQLIDFKLERLYVSDLSLDFTLDTRPTPRSTYYLVYFEPTSQQFTTLRRILVKYNEFGSVNYTINDCRQTTTTTNTVGCVQLESFVFNPYDDFISIFETSCALSLTSSSNQRSSLIRLSKWSTSPNSVLLKLNANLKSIYHIDERRGHTNDDLCSIYLMNRLNGLVRVEYSFKDLSSGQVDDWLDLNRTSGVAKLTGHPPPNGLKQIEIEANVYFQRRKLKISNKLTVQIELENDRYFDWDQFQIESIISPNQLVHTFKQLKSNAIDSIELKLKQNKQIQTNETLFKILFNSGVVVVVADRQHGRQFETIYCNGINVNGTIDWSIEWSLCPFRLSDTNGLIDYVGVESLKFETKYKMIVMLVRVNGEQPDNNNGHQNLSKIKYFKFKIDSASSQSPLLSQPTLQSQMNKLVFDQQNCSILIKPNKLNVNGTGGLKGLVNQTEPGLFLIKLNPIDFDCVRNKSFCLTSNYEFSLTELNSNENDLLLNKCFLIDSSTGRVYLTNKCLNNLMKSKSSTSGQTSGNGKASIKQPATTRLKKMLRISVKSLNNQRHTDSSSSSSSSSPFTYLTIFYEPTNKLPKRSNDELTSGQFSVSIFNCSESNKQNEDMWWSMSNNMAESQLEIDRQVDKILVKDLKRIISRKKPTTPGTTIGNNSMTEKLEPLNLTRTNNIYQLNIDYSINESILLKNAKINSNTKIYQIDVDQLVAALNIRHNQQVDIDIDSSIFEFNLIENKNDLFKMNKRTGLIELAREWSFDWYEYVRHGGFAYSSGGSGSFKYEIKFNLTKLNYFYLISNVQETNNNNNNNNNYELVANIYFRFDSSIFINKKNILPVPKLAQYNYDLIVNSSTKRNEDYLLIDKLEIYLVGYCDRLSPNDIYNISYSLKPDEFRASIIQELPFYIDPLNGRLFYSSHSSDHGSLKYEFSILIKFRLGSNELMLLHELNANVVVNIDIKSHRRTQLQQGNKQPSDLFNNKKSQSNSHHQVVTSVIDLSVPITSSEFIALMQCPLIGFFQIDSNSFKENIETIRPSFRLVLPKLSSTTKTSSTPTPATKQSKRFNTNRTVYEHKQILKKQNGKGSLVKHSTETNSRETMTSGSLKFPLNSSINSKRINLLTSKKKVISLNKRDSMDEYVFGAISDDVDEWSSSDTHQQQLSAGGGDKKFEDDQIELKILYETFYSQLYLDESTGALYLNLNDNQKQIQNQQQIYTKLAKLINFFHYERNKSRKRVRVDALIYLDATSHLVSNQTSSIWIDLVFKRAPLEYLRVDESTKNNNQHQQQQLDALLSFNNKFQINSNNLLNLLNNGDEFMLSFGIEENLPTWLTNSMMDENGNTIDDQLDLSDGLLVNIRKYLESKLDYKRNFIYLNMLKQLRYYLVDSTSTTTSSTSATGIESNLLSNNYFRIEDNLNGILLTKPSIQFDYEVERTYKAKVMIVQYLSDNEADVDVVDDETTSDGSTQSDDYDYSDGSLNDLSTKSKIADRKSEQKKFVYWLDVNINVLNVADEPIVCEKPIYYINVDENEMKSKKLFTIRIKDFDENFAGGLREDDGNFKGQILTGNAQGLFNMNGLSLYTGSSTRKLDRETRWQHELEIKITETSSASYSDTNNSSSRFALCKIIVNVNDINDNRPILNDIELVIYNKLDSKLIEDLKIPIANAIAIDPDQISKLTYSIVSVRYWSPSQNSLSKNLRRAKRNVDVTNDGVEDHQQQQQPVASMERQHSNANYDIELNKLFTLNTTTGYLYSTRTEMPCIDCTIQIVYRANDIGKMKTRVSRKSSIKLHVKSLPLSLFKISGENDLTSSSSSNNIGTEINQQVSTSSIDQVYPSIRTFELYLQNSTTHNFVILNINEDIKLGEKLYQIRIKQKLKSTNNQLAIIYFTLLEQGNINQTFYMTNHDGSLYLVKPLDYDTADNDDQHWNGHRPFYNLTILITNWIGQIEYVYIQINVKDSNDNRPRFNSSTYDLNEIIQINDEPSNLPNDYLINLASAYDVDDLDRGKLTFKIEDCFYLSKNILIKRPYLTTTMNGVMVNPSTNHLTYPLCAKRFIELMPLGLSDTKNYQSIGLMLKLNEFVNYLLDSSDFYLANYKKQLMALISFYVDVSVKDSSLTSSSFTRINLNIYLNRTAKFISLAKDEQREKTDALNKTSNHNNQNNNNTMVKYGFKKLNYLVQIRSSEQLKIGAELIRLNDEVVWVDDQHVDNDDVGGGNDGDGLEKSKRLHLFSPFELSFYLKPSGSFSMEKYFSIEPNIGTIFINRTIFDSNIELNKLNRTFVFKLSVGCKLKQLKKLSNFVESSEYDEPKLFKSAQIIFSIEKSAIYSQVDLKDLIYRPIWSSINLSSYLYENVPIGSWLNENTTTTIAATNLESMTPFTVKNFLNLKTIESIQSLLPSQNVLASISFGIDGTDDDDDKEAFEIDSTSGYLRSRIEPDFELKNIYNLKIVVCLNNLDQLVSLSRLCFKQYAHLDVFILNKNDNEPKIIPLVLNQNTLSIGKSSHDEISLNLFNTSELIRSMSLFKLTANDSDGDLNSIEYSLVNAMIIVRPSNNQRDQVNVTCSNDLSMPTPTLEWFDLFDVDNQTKCIKLTDTGYDSLIKISKRFSHNHSTFSNCHFIIELISSVNDGLFSNEKSFYLNIFLYEDTAGQLNEQHSANTTYSSLRNIRKGLVVPILSSIEMNENIGTNYLRDEYLVNMPDMLVGYLTTNLLTSKNLTEMNRLRDYMNENLNNNNNNNSIEFELINYENLFVINKTRKSLYARKQMDTLKFDRETRSSYELFISIRLNESLPDNLLLKQRHLIPSRARILIKLNDLNDNRPQFVQPDEIIRVTRDTHELFDSFSYNQTFKWTRLVNSSNKNPLLIVSAIDADSGPNGLVNYFIRAESSHSSSSLNRDLVDSLIAINKSTGHLYLNPNFNKNSSNLIQTQFASPNDEIFLELNVIARDHGQPNTQESILSLRLHFLFDNKSAQSSVDNQSSTDVYFNETFYYFKIPESIQANQIFGLLNSVKYFDESSSSWSRKDKIIYSIVDGDEFDKFQIDYLTGALSARVELDYEQKRTYYLTIQAFSNLNRNKHSHSNCTVRIDLIDVNDNEPQFDKYEYKLTLNENLAKMSELFRLSATDGDSVDSPNSQVRYQLMNHLDKFYLNEITGVVFNKITFDYESMRTDALTLSSLSSASAAVFFLSNITSSGLIDAYEANSLSQFNTIQLKIRAYDLGNQPASSSSLTGDVVESRSLETSCILTIKISNLNDNPPQFEKAVYFSQIEVNEPDDDDGEDDEETKTESILGFLLDPNTFETNNSSIQFVTKVNAKDVDTQTLFYSITKQTLLVDSADTLSSSSGKYYDLDQMPSLFNQFASDNLFFIENRTGIVYLNLKKLNLLKKLNEQVRQQASTGSNGGGGGVGGSSRTTTRKLDDSMTFSLQLAVTDTMFTSQTRLTVQVDTVPSTSKFIRPKFKTNQILINLNSVNLNNKKIDGNNFTYQLINLNKKVERPLANFIYSINLDYPSPVTATTSATTTTMSVQDLFSIKSNKYLMVNLKNLNEQIKNLKLILKMPLSLCDAKQTGICDQTLVLVNLTEYIRNMNNLNKEPQSSSSSSQPAQSIETANNNNSIKFSFAYNYATVTVQQQSFSSTSIQASKPTDIDLVNGVSSGGQDLEEDYETDEIYESNERFYFEIKTNILTKDENLQDPSQFDEFKNQFEFELANCTYTGLNVSFINVTIAKQIKNLQLNQFNHQNRVPTQQLKSLFSLNKHNGVLTSRRIINAMLPGLYLFNIRLKSNTSSSTRGLKSIPSSNSNNNNKSGVDSDIEIVDSMTFKLIILPPNNWLRANSKVVYNYFKFAREFYKFKMPNILKNESTTTIVELGQLRLINRVEQQVYLSPKSIYQLIPKLNTHKIKYRLIESKFFKEILGLFDLNTDTGLLSIRPTKNLIDLIRPRLNEDGDLVIYVLATVSIENNATTRSNNHSIVTNTLEYLCEIQIDFKSVLSKQNRPSAAAAGAAAVGTGNNMTYTKQNENEELTNGQMIQFGKSFNRLRLIENLKLNTAIHRFVAFTTILDDDSGPNCTIEYSIDVSNSTYDTFFNIEPRTGLLKIVKNLDKEYLNNENIIFMVKACCVSEVMSKTYYCARTNVLVDLIDQNDNRPLFEKSVYDGSIREDALPGTVVATLVAFDADSSTTRSGHNGDEMLQWSHEIKNNALLKSNKIEYFIMNGDSLNQFAIASDGKVYTRLMIDREQVRSYSLDIMAFDGRFKSLTKLDIRVMDVSDSRPECQQSMINLNLSESLPVGHIFYQAKPVINVDTDLHKNLFSYDLITLEQNDNIDQIYLNRSLNRFARERIVANFGVYKEMSSDNSFTNLPFSINENTGSIRISEPLDYETQRFYSFYVRIHKSNEPDDSRQLRNGASSGSGGGQQQNRRLHTPTKSILPMSSYCLIRINIALIDENDNKPEFFQKTYTSSIIENSPFGSLLDKHTQIKSIDYDSKLNGVVRYSLVIQNTSSSFNPNADDVNLFKIDPKLGLISLNTASLDRETMGDWINYTIRGEDMGRLYTNVEYSIRILDSNDNRPRFDKSEYFLSVQENLPVGFKITKMTANDLDLNANTEYYILKSKTPENEMSKFRVEKSTGFVLVNQELDYEQQSQHFIYIIAIDPELDNLTFIESLHGDGLEKSAYNNSIIKLVVDLLDLNDNAPEFDTLTPSDIYFNENKPVNSTVFTFRAFDSDKTERNTKLSYEIVRGNDWDYFGMDRDSGRLFSKIVFDYESSMPRYFELAIQCADHGEPVSLKTNTKLKIHINDVNDNEPVFLRKNQTLIFRESFQLGDEITKFPVNDPDTFNQGGPPFIFAIMQQYRISTFESDLTRSDGEEMLKTTTQPPATPIQLTEPIFGINANNSLILVRKPLSNQTYIVQIRCYDSGLVPLYSDTYLTIKITDPSSHEPKMNNTNIEIVTIGWPNDYDSAEFSLIKISPDQIIGELKAIDLDTQDNLFYELSNRQDELVDYTKHNLPNADKYFSVNKLTGVLKTNKELIDSAEFNLKAIVTDKKFITETDLNIQVTNIRANCLFNSLFMKLNVWQKTNESSSTSRNDESSKVSLDEFVQNGYLNRFRDVLYRMLNTNKNAEFGSRLYSFNRSSILIIGIRHVDIINTNKQDPTGYATYNDEINIDPQITTGSIIEILFSVKRKSNAAYNEDDTNDECLDSKILSKFLNKRKSILIKRIRSSTYSSSSSSSVGSLTVSNLSRTNSSAAQQPAAAATSQMAQLKLKLIDLSFNSECSTKSFRSSSQFLRQVSICSTNQALQTCKLNFKTYNAPGTLCEYVEAASLTKCLLMPTYDWNCEYGKSLESSLENFLTTPATTTTRLSSTIKTTATTTSKGLTNFPTFLASSSIKIIETTRSTDQSKEKLIFASNNNNNSSSSSQTETQSTSKYGSSCRKPFNPCKNNAICKQVKVTSLQSGSVKKQTSTVNSSSSSTSSFRIRIHCFCPNGFKGQFCEDDVDECTELDSHMLSNGGGGGGGSGSGQAETDAGPCAPNAKCINTHGSYYCNCTTKPTSSCYNTLSPQYSASTADLFDKKSNLRNLKYTNYRFKLKNSERIDSVEGKDDYIGEFEIVDPAESETADPDSSNYVLFGTISSNTIRQALLGIFGAICAILIVLSLAAAIVCKMNLSRSRNFESRSRYKKNKNEKMSSLIEQHQQRPHIGDSIGDTSSNNEHIIGDVDGVGAGSGSGVMTSNSSSGEHDLCSSNTSSPCSFKTNNNSNCDSDHLTIMMNSSSKILKSKTIDRNRSSMTSSLISSSNGVGCCSDSSNILIQSTIIENKEKQTAAAAAAATGTTLNKNGKVILNRSNSKETKRNGYFKYSINNLLFAKLNSKSSNQTKLKEINKKKQILTSSSQVSSSACDSSQASTSPCSPCSPINGGGILYESSTQTLLKKKQTNNNKSTFSTTLESSCLIEKDDENLTVEIYGAPRTQLDKLNHIDTDADYEDNETNLNCSIITDTCLSEDKKKLFNNNHTMVGGQDTNKLENSNSLIKTVNKYTIKTVGLSNHSNPNANSSSNAADFNTDFSSFGRDTKNNRKKLADDSNDFNKLNTTTTTATASAATGKDLKSHKYEIRENFFKYDTICSISNDDKNLIGSTILINDNKEKISLFKYNTTVPSSSSTSSASSSTASSSGNKVPNGFQINSSSLLNPKRSNYGNKIDEMQEFYMPISQSSVKEVRFQKPQTMRSNTTTFLPNGTNNLNEINNSQQTRGAAAATATTTTTTSDNKQSDLDKDDSINTAEECSQGFYWDITDWAGGLTDTDTLRMNRLNTMSANNNNDNLNPQLPKITSHLSKIIMNQLVSNGSAASLVVKPSSSGNFSPIYSKVYKGIKYSNERMKKLNTENENLLDDLRNDDEEIDLNITINSTYDLKQNEDEEDVQLDIDGDDDDDDETSRFKLDLNPLANNYMYLMNTSECDQTPETQSNIGDTETLSSKAAHNLDLLSNEDIGQQGEYFMPFSFKS